MPKSRTEHSTPKLSEVARHVVIPEGIVTTAWPRVVAKCAEMGVTFDEWQNGIGEIALGKRADGKYAATVGGVVLSIPRQVGKTFLVGMIIIALCILHPGLTVLWTAHRTRTTSKTFGTLKGMTSRKKIKPHMLDPRNTNGEQEIRFRNGSIIMFGARADGFGRGFDEVDVEVFDEAQILTEKALEDMIPAANQSRQESGALLFFMGTPPRPTDPGEEFTNRRKKALVGKPDDQVKVIQGNLVYVELSADDDADADDQKQWAKANPSFPVHTPVESMERMREQLTDADSFRREALGIWDDDLSSAKIPARVWAKNLTQMPLKKLDRTSEPIVSVDLRTGLEQSLSIGYAVEIGDKDYVALALHVPGVGQAWDFDFAVREVQEVLKRQKTTKVAIDAFGDGNGLLIPLLENAGIEVVKLSTQDMRNAAVGLVDGNLNYRILHGAPAKDEPDYLTVAVAGSATKTSADGYLWAQLRSIVDIGPLRAVTVAWWVLHKSRGSNYDLRDSFG